MFGLAVQDAGFPVVFFVGLDHDLEHPGDLFGSDPVDVSSVFRGLAGVGFDDLTEGDGAAHGIGVGRLFGLDGLVFGEGLPATDDLGGIIHAETVVFVFQEILQAAADMGLVHGEDDDLVGRPIDLG